MRDIMAHPYSSDEQRVSDYIQDITAGTIGSGDDPIGFLIASHASLVKLLKETRDDLLVIASSSRL
jgi:hypothetical protein